MLGSRKALGLAVTERSVTAVEVAAAHGRRKVLRAAEFPMPEGDAARDPAVLGKALRQFLRQNRFSASRCVIGMWARWLVAKEKSLPRTTADLMTGVLSMAAEREFASDPKDLAFDYSGPVDSPQGHSVFLVAASRRNVEHLVASAREAGLKVAAVTSSMMALARATAGPPARRRMMLYLSSAGAEMTVESGGGFRLLRGLPLPPAAAAGTTPENGWLDSLAGELRRVLALLPGSQGPPQNPDLVIWNAAGLSAEALDAMGKQLSCDARLCEVSADLGIADGAAAAPSGNLAAAAALALAGIDSRMLAVDLLHSRLDPRKKIALRKKVAWGVALAALLVLAGLVLLIDWWQEEQEVQGLKDQHSSMKESLAAAKDVVVKTAFARGWYDLRPKHLDCLRELTLAFPAEGRIWTTSLAISEDMRILVSGKAMDGNAVLEVVDRLKANPKFSDVKHLYTRDVGGGAPEVSFAISLAYRAAERP
jgi:hypothetical protein